MQQVSKEEVEKFMPQDATDKDREAASKEVALQAFANRGDPMQARLRTKLATWIGISGRFGRT